MKKSRFNDEQILGAMKLADSGIPVGDVCRELGISHNTFYQWKKKYAGTSVTDARRLRELEKENNRLRRLVTDLTLDRHVLQEIIAKKL